LIRGIPYINAALPPRRLNISTHVFSTIHHLIEGGEYVCESIID
jgi:hypothetical protein